MSFYKIVGKICNNLTTVEGSLIHCGSAIPREGDACNVTYNNVTELRVCQENMEWTISNSKCTVRYCIIIILCH